MREETEVRESGSEFMRLLHPKKSKFSYTPSIYMFLTTALWIMIAFIASFF